ncbi:hypothetical protein LAZ67_1007731, partial [Cordylochernes scorpioides]
METSEALHWTRQQQQRIDMDPEQQLYTPKIGHCDCCDRDVWRHLRLFIGHDNNKDIVKIEAAWPEFIVLQIKDNMANHLSLQSIEWLHTSKFMILQEADSQASEK